MSHESVCVDLPGMDFEINRISFLSEQEVIDGINTVGNKLADRLAKLVGTVDGGSDFTMYEFDDPRKADGEDDNLGLSLRAGDFYIDTVLFFRDREYGYYSLAILGGTNSQSDLFCGYGSELQVAFRLQNEKLEFSEVVFMGQETHNLSSVVEGEIDDKTRLRIMLMADRVADVFMRMSLLKEKFV